MRLRACMWMSVGKREEESKREELDTVENTLFFVAKFKLLLIIVVFILFTMRCLKWYLTVGSGKARATQEQTMRYTHMRHLREESDGYRKCKAEGQSAHHGVDGQVHARVRLQKLCPVMSDKELARNQKQFCAQPHTHPSTRPHTHPPAHTHTSTRPHARSTHSFILS